MVVYLKKTHRRRSMNQSYNLANSSKQRKFFLFTVYYSVDKIYIKKLDIKMYLIHYIKQLSESLTKLE